MSTEAEERSWSDLPKDAAPDGDSSPFEASTAVDVLGRQLSSLRTHLPKSESDEFRGMLSEADLPELDHREPMLALAARLDREADLWRGLALRAMSRTVSCDRLVMVTVVLALFSALGLTAVCGMSGLLGDSALLGRALVLFCGGALLVSMVLTANVAAERVRNAQAEIARQALRRADLTELRVHRLAFVLEARSWGKSAYREAVETLRSELSAK